MTNRQRQLNVAQMSGAMFTPQMASEANPGGTIAERAHPQVVETTWKIIRQ